MSLGAPCRSRYTRSVDGMHAAACERVGVPDVMQPSRRRDRLRNEAVPPPSGCDARYPTDVVPARPCASEQLTSESLGVGPLARSHDRGHPRRPRGACGRLTTRQRDAANPDGHSAEQEVAPWQTALTRAHATRHRKTAACTPFVAGIASQSARDGYSGPSSGIGAFTDRVPAS